MTKPLVGIIMGSDSDLEIMAEAGEALKEFGVLHEINVVSAHRTPKWAYQYVKEAKERGVKVIIAGAGGAAHLAGVAASLTTLPVIGVPIYTKSLDGLDSLLSTVQMPPGIPVAAVAINGAKNAGLLAIKILATSDERLANKLKTYSKKLAFNVLSKNEKLKTLGVKKYLQQLKEK